MVPIDWCTYLQFLRIHIDRLVYASFLTFQHPEEHVGDLDPRPCVRPWR